MQKPTPRFLPSKVLAPLRGPAVKQVYSFWYHHYGSQTGFFCCCRRCRLCAGELHLCQISDSAALCWSFNLDHWGAQRRVQSLLTGRIKAPTMCSFNLRTLRPAADGVRVPSDFSVLTGAAPPHRCIVDVVSLTFQRVFRISRVASVPQ